MAEKKQFDEFLGGSEKLPREADILKLVTARASEMAAMTYSLKNPQQTKLIFQKLPVHMRRRVMSHNAKRMPRKLRNGHLSQMKKSGLPPKSKRPSRKYRRRPQNLLLEYNRRQRNKFWLETHIWHAKRFKMSEKWGFKLADKSNDRCFRASYRAVTSHCLIQDISYYTCIEIKGPFNILKEKLKMHCDLNKLTFAAKIYTNGEREGTLMFYKKNGCPFSPIGHVDFMWQANDADTKTIWIWVHPAFYGNVLTELVDNFNFQLKERKSHVDTGSKSIGENVKSKENEQFKIFLTTKIPTYDNDEGCQMTILRNCLNRFRLCGPLALSIFTDAFKFPNIDSNLVDKRDKAFTLPEDNSGKSCISREDESWQMNLDINDENKHSIDAWFKSYYQSQDNIEVFKIQRDVYNRLRNLKSPNQLPPNMVLALTVLDPRFYLPQRRSKSLLNGQVSERIPMPPTLANKSPLCDANIRSYVIKNSTSATAIHKLRSECLVPGVSNDQFFNEDIMHKIPILMIQKPGNYLHNNAIGFGSGIDIVLPAGWAMPFWLALILRCSKAGGLRESKSIAYENSNFNMPAINQPDTEAYKDEAKFQKAALTERYFRLPSNKRVNYTKFGITSPFFCQWSLLMKEWIGRDSFYVLRDNRVLSMLRDIVSSNLKKQKRNQIKTDNLLQDLEALVDKKNCLIPVKVTIERKGVANTFSIICVPKQEDLVNYNTNKSWSGPVESAKVDENEEERKKSRRGHLALLRRLRRQRVRAKKKMEDARCNMSIKDSIEMKHLEKFRKLAKKKLLNSNKSIIDQQAQRMADLYLPKCTSVRQSCDREVIGYVTNGGFSFSEAKGVGLGYVTFPSLLLLIKSQSSIVLTRNTSTRKYRICKLEILD